MKINTAPTDIAVMGNIDSVKEFTIKSTARSFQILSSGLYSNKIRAIIRELSCNAYDSHVAAGVPDKKFEVHLPTAVEPWFSIRDFGVGLDQTQVKNLYTTYFESTKTDSNDYVGALGLGSKSPFSYTDNFTVTAIKNGLKGVYTAFVNPQGVPSVALMTESKTRELTGVEIRMSVDNNSDFYKFTDEALRVYRYFATRPVVKGPSGFTFSEIEYEDRDVIPGVHVRDAFRSNFSNAIMGNICYPIDVPNKEKTIGELAHLLSCGLDIHFPIGSLDFQASREGLSYIPQTIDAIKAKLEELQASVFGKIESEVNAITNDWEKLDYLQKKSRMPIWQIPIMAFIKTSNIPTIAPNIRQVYPKPIKLLTASLRADFNISLSLFDNYRKMCAVRPVSYYDGSKVQEGHEIGPVMNTKFIINDLKSGHLVRCRVWAENNQVRNVIILSPADNSKPMDVDGFMLSIHSPPESIKMKASDIPKPEKVQTEVAPAVIMRYDDRSYSQGWKCDKNISAFDDTQTYYYVNLKGNSLMSDYGITDMAALVIAVHTSGVIAKLPTIYGIRRTAAADIEGKTNWLKFEDLIKENLTKLPREMLVSTVSQETQPARRNMSIEMVKNITSQVDPKSTFAEYAEFDTSTKKTSYRSYVGLRMLLTKFLGDDTELVKLMKTFEILSTAVFKKYPLLKSIDFYGVDSSAVANYINIVDQHQKENV